MSANFKYRCELSAHTGDVRSICCPKRGLLLTASRDFSVRSWNIDATSPNTGEGKVYSNHSNYVSAVSYLHPSERFPGGLILTASNDRIIRGFEENVSDPVFVLHGHSDAVCALDVNSEGSILSGSWDSTAKLWTTDNCLATMKRLGATIWSVLFLPTPTSSSDSIRIATGSSDSVICIWLLPHSQLPTVASTQPLEMDKPAKMLIGHTDCVRALAMLENSWLLSASNDGSLRCWDLASETCVAEFYGHTSFVYSVAVDPANKFIVSSGEDRTVRVWPIPERSSGLQQIDSKQTLILPCQTAWCVAVTTEGDIAVGSSDNKVRLFSQSSERQASPDALRAYESELACSEVPGGTLQVLESQQVPGVEALLAPGKKDGHISVIREDSKLMCYQWSAGQNRWIKVGDVVGSVAESAVGDNRTLFEGKEYDFVFTVDFDENMPPVKLPFNKADDPWLAAQTFLHRNNLPQDYLDTVAKYIIKNAGLSESDQLTPGHVSVEDPFTGGGRYVPGGEYRERERPTGDNSYFPCANFVKLDVSNISMLLRKLNTLNESAKSPLPSRAITLIGAMSPTAPTADAIELTKAILTVLHDWTTDSAFPLLDLLRCLVLIPGVSELVFMPDAWSTCLHVSGLHCLLDPHDEESASSLSAGGYTCLLFILRLMTNSLAVDVANSINAPNPPTSICTIMKITVRLANLVECRKIDLSERKQHQVALASLLHNLAVLAHLQSRKGTWLGVLPALRGLPGLCTRTVVKQLILEACNNGVTTGPIDMGLITRMPTDAVLRLFTALGTALVTSVPPPEFVSEETKTGVFSQRVRLVSCVTSPSHTDNEMFGWERFRAFLVLWAEAAAAPIKVRECASSLLRLFE